MLYGIVIGFCVAGVLACLLSDKFDVKIYWKNSNGEYKDLNW